MTGAILLARSIAALTEGLAMVQSWILESNLVPLLEVLSHWAGYKLDDGDQAAFEIGLGATDVDHDSRFEYELVGCNPIKLAVARDRGSIVLFVKAEADPATENRIGVVVDLMADYRLTRS